MGGHIDTARIRLWQLRELVHGLRLEVAGWLNDFDLHADQTLLDSYLAVLGTPAATAGAQRIHIAESLEYAAQRKLQPQPR